MGFEPFKWEDNTMRIDFEGEQWVLVQAEMSHWDRKRYRSGLVRIKTNLDKALVAIPEEKLREGTVDAKDLAGSMDAEFALDEIDMLLMEINIKDWSFKGKDGVSTAPIDRYHLERLDERVMEQICAKIYEQNSDLIFPTAALKKAKKGK